MDNAVPPRVPDHELIEIIGRGSYGQVWRARSLTLGTMRAVKVIWRANFESERPFLREFNGIKRFEPVSRSHEGLVDILQVGRNEELGYFYYVMELADNAQGDLASETESSNYKARTLRSEIDHYGQLPAKACVPLFMTLAAALDHIHRLGLIHRDIKPSNIVLIDGVAKIADIGLVAEARESRSFVGTEGFVPQEGPNSALADVFSLGKTLYEATTGLDRLKFPSLPATRGHIRELEGMMELNAVAMRACAPNPAERYGSAAAMLADLAVMQDGKSVRDLHRGAARLRMARKLMLFAFFVALVTASFGGVSAWIAHSERNLREKTQVLLTRAESAESLAKARLLGQSLALAKAECLSSELGRRFRALDALREAAKSQPGDVELRSQVCTALSIPDLREVRRHAPYRNDKGALYQEISPQLDRIAKVTPEQAISVVSLATPPAPTLLLPAQGQAKEPLYVKFSPDGKRLMAWHRTGEVVIWDATSGAVLRRLPPESTKYAYEVVLFRQDSQSIYWLEKGGIAIQSLTGDVRSHIPLPVHPPKAPITLLCEERHGKVLAASRFGGPVYLVNLDQGRMEQDLTGFSGAFSLQLSATADQAIVHQSGQVWQQDLTLPDSVPRLLLTQTNALTLVNFAPLEDVLFLSGWDDVTRIYSFSEHKVLSISPIAMRTLAIPPGKEIVRGACLDAQDLSVVEFEWGNRTACRPLPPPPIPLENVTATFSQDGRWLVVSGKQRVTLVDRETLKPALRVPSSYCRKAICTTTDLITATQNGIWKMSRDHLPRPGAAEEVTEPFLLLRTGNIMDIATSKDNSMLVGISTNRAYVMKQGDLLGKEWPTLGGAVTVYLSPNGRWLLTRGNPIALYDLESSEPSKPVMTRVAEAISFASFTGDSRRLLLPLSSGLVCWDIQTQQEIWRTPQTIATEGSVCCSPDSKWVATKTAPSTFALLDADTGTLLAKFRSPQSGVIGSMEFSPDSQSILVNEEGDQARVWDLGYIRSQLAGMGLDW